MCCMSFFILIHYQHMYEVKSRIYLWFLTNPKEAYCKYGVIAFSSLIALFSNYHRKGLHEKLPLWLDEKLDICVFTTGWQSIEHIHILQLDVFLHYHFVWPIARLPLTCNALKYKLVQYHVYVFMPNLLHQKFLRSEYSNAPQIYIVNLTIHIPMLEC